MRAGVIRRRIPTLLRAMPGDQLHLFALQGIQLRGTNEALFHERIAQTHAVAAGDDHGLLQLRGGDQFGLKGKTPEKRQGIRHRTDVIGAKGSEDEDSSHSAVSAVRISLCLRTLEA